MVTEQTPRCDVPKRRRSRAALASSADAFTPPRSDTLVPRDLRVTTLPGEYAVLSFSLSPVTLPESFSPAEREVAAAIAVGCSNAAIAKRRGTSVRTVENQIYGIFRKLGIGSRSELAAYLA